MQKLKLENFRGFVGTHEIDLDADLVLISGKNGVGKTSLLLALNLLLNGQTSSLEKLGATLTKGASSGTLETTGAFAKKIDLMMPPPPVLHADLLERAHFFIADSIDSPESSSDVLSILEPQAGAWVEIKPALQSAVDEIARHRKELVARVADTQSARRTAARRFENARAALDVDAFEWTANIRDVQSLLLTQDNLANHWESQLRNLVATIGSIVGSSSTPSTDVATTLTELAQLLKILRNNVAHSSGRPESKHNLIAALENRLEFSADAPFFWARELPIYPRASDAPVSLPVDAKSEQIWREKIGETQDKYRTFERRLRELDRFLSDFDSPLESLTRMLEQIGEVAPPWLGQMDRHHPDDERVHALHTWLRDTVEKTPLLRAGVARYASALEEERLHLADIVRELGEVDTQLQHELSCAAVLQGLKEEPWVQSATTIGDLKGQVKDILDTERYKESRTDRVAAQLATLEEATVAWANIERAIEAETLRAREATSLKEAEKTFVEAERTLKQALSNDGIFSLASAMNGGQLEQLLLTLNRLLARFHFPKDFLPIRLARNPGRSKATVYSFVSRNGVNFQGLSTGQKTQLAISWSVCLSYALRDRLMTPLIAFDDFTTALDMGQLIPAAGILRQLAYSTSQQYHRQVILTSHHEQMTNYLIDYLLPPPGKSMKVIHIEEWTPARGPSIVEYNAKMPNDSEPPDPVSICRWLQTQLHGRTH
ncbi:AAA family ATPase [Burkholderia sp. WP9]|uniref:AAA family ATPase n=1 Tax=Burkholderia sp. WP9 TaxID=1500263 RepID=UPI0015A63E93|nr:AAA family ATPase [Burkholderia sp. WP9]